MAPLQRLVIAVLKPHEPATHAFTQQVATADTVTSVNATFVELDKDVLNLRLISEKDTIEYDEVEASIEDADRTIHPVEQAVYGEYIVEDTPTPQDRWERNPIPTQTPTSALTPNPS